MKRFTLATMLAGSIFAGLLGTAGTAQAEHRYVYDDNGYSYGHGYNYLRPFVPHVDTSVHTRPIIIRPRDCTAARKGPRPRRFRAFALMRV